MPHSPEEEMKELFPDSEYKHPDLYFRFTKQGEAFTFYASTDGKIWEQVTHSIIPGGDFDIVIPVTVSGKGDEDDII